MRRHGSALLKTRPTRHSQRANDLRRHRSILALVGLWVTALWIAAMGFNSGSSHAEQHRPIRIGALTDSWGATPHIIGLQDGLVELGYQPDRDFFLGVRFTSGSRDMLPTAARELVQAGADLLFVDSIVTAQAAQQATAEIPIVFTSVEDPVGSGLIESYAQPGGNMTGVASLDIELGPKRLQVFQELIPELRRVLFLYDHQDLYSAEAAALYKQAARQLGVEWVEVVVRTAAEAQRVLSEVHQRRIDGVLTPRCCASNIPGLIVEATLAQQIPTMFHSAAYWIEAGALASYGPDLYTSGRQSARIVDKIIQGADPGAIPVEVNSEIKFTINLRTADALALSISPEVLSYADEVRR
ncbi:MAG TPA: ABC transporter substrate-binding protein [Afifellaceae bacterium]|nr:ABC transporter substrate-binding protein [Afifellaceae bacterium]